MRSLQLTLAMWCQSGWLSFQDACVVCRMQKHAMHLNAQRQACSPAPQPQSRRRRTREFPPIIPLSAAGIATQCAPTSVSTGAAAAEPSARFDAGSPVSSVTACIAAAARVPGDALTCRFPSRSSDRILQRFTHSATKALTSTELSGSVSSSRGRPMPRSVEAHMCRHKWQDEV